MFHVLGRFPSEFGVAVSGGIDSMVLLDYIRRFPKFRISLVHFDHGTEHGGVAKSFIEDIASDLKLPLHLGTLACDKPKGSSWEEHWRSERYRFIDSLGIPVATAHTLDDVVETWLFSAIHGTPKLIPFRRNQIFRPFLCVPKTHIQQWADRNAVAFVQDMSNLDTKYMRNLIRADLVPTALRVNPGIRTTIKKKLLERGVGYV